MTKGGHRFIAQGSAPVILMNRPLNRPEQSLEFRLAPSVPFMAYFTLCSRRYPRMRIGRTGSRVPIGFFEPVRGPVMFGVHTVFILPSHKYVAAGGLSEALEFRLAPSSPFRARSYCTSAQICAGFLSINPNSIP